MGQAEIGDKMEIRRTSTLFFGIVSLAFYAFLGLGTCECVRASIVVDLTDTGSVTGSIDGAVFTRDTEVLAGTGVFGTFVMIQAQGNNTIEKGYNSTGRPLRYDEKNSIHTHDLLAGDIPIVEWDGKDYFEFLLDINEPDNNSDPVDSFISLDTVKIYSSTTNFAADDANPLIANDLGILQYDMGIVRQAETKYCLTTAYSPMEAAGAICGCSFQSGPEPTQTITCTSTQNLGPRGSWLPEKTAPVLRSRSQGRPLRRTIRF